MSPSRCIRAAAIALLTLFAPLTNAQSDPVSVIYINGIKNTLVDAQTTALKIQERLDSSPNHPLGVSRRFFVVDVVWNPIGWYGPPDQDNENCDAAGLPSCLKQDLMELFLLKTAEENFEADFVKLLSPHDRPAPVDRSAAAKVAAYLDDMKMMPGGNSLEATGKMNDERMNGTQRAAGNLVSRIQELGSAVVVAHSQGNLLANLAWAKLASTPGIDVLRTMRLVNVANTAMYAVNNLNFTHEGDAAIFSAATKRASPVGDQSLQTLPARENWTRTTQGIHGCANDGTCLFWVAENTFGKMEGDIDYPNCVPGITDCAGVVDFYLNHSIVLTYLSTATVPVIHGQGVQFTPQRDTFVDRFEDFVYAAAGSLLTSRNAPAIGDAGQPRSVSVMPGQSATFTVVASGTEPLSYQWRRNGVNVICASGSNCLSYTTPATTLADNGAVYSVVVTNAAGTATSDNATLTVTAAPTIVSGPSSTATLEGARAEFSVSATGDRPLSYQWFSNGTAIAGATGASYAIEAVTAADSGRVFSATVTNTGGSATSQGATLTVVASPAVAPAPSVSSVSPTSMVANGTNQPLTLTGSGFTSGNIVQFRWGAGSGAGVWNNSSSPITSLTASRIVVPMNPGTVTDTIYVRVCRSAATTTASDCSDGSAAVVVAVSIAVVAPGISGAGQPQSASVIAGQTATFTVAASGTPSLTYQWRKNGTNVSCSSGPNCPSYTTPVTTAADNGAVYSVVVSNAAGSATSSSATLTVVASSAGPASLRLAAGWGFTLAVKADNTLWGVGENYYGALGISGLSADDYTATWIQIPTLAGIASVDSGNGHSLAVSQQGFVWATGRNAWGQLGLGDTSDRAIWTRVPNLSNVKAVSAGDWGNSLAVTNDGAIWATGDGISGNFGIVAPEFLTSWVQIPGTSGFVAISAGGGHSLALKADGSLWVTGSDCSGQLGLGLDWRASIDCQLNQWTLVNGVANVVGIAAGSGHSLAVKADGTVWVAGNNLYGQIGMGQSGGVVAWTKTALTDAVGVAAGDNTSFVLKRDGTVWVTGWNGEGQLGIGGFQTPQRSWKQSALPAGAKAIAGSFYHSVTILSDGRLAGTGWTVGAFGSNDFSSANTDISTWLFVDGQSGF